MIQTSFSQAYFNPRPPRGGRPFPNCQGKNLDTFQSTPSARRATNVTLGFVEHLNISIHALREEGDHRIDDLEHINQLFQSTPSARRATALVKTHLPHLNISIHALREEGDAATLPLVATARNFNPRPPRGERRAHSTNWPATI